MMVKARVGQCKASRGQQRHQLRLLITGADQSSPRGQTGLGQVRLQTRQVHGQTQPLTELQSNPTSMGLLLINPLAWSVESLCPKSSSHGLAAVSLIDYITHVSVVCCPVYRGGQRSNPANLRSLEPAIQARQMLLYRTWIAQSATPSGQIPWPLQ